MHNLINPITQLDLVSNYKIVHPIMAQYMLIFNVLETLSKIKYIWGHKISLNTSKRTDIIQLMF